jgi:hypothetical protein
MWVVLSVSGGLKLIKGGGLILTTPPSTLPPQEEDVGVLRLDDWQAIREPAKQGLTISAIVKETRFGRDTDKKHLRSAPPAAARRGTCRRSRPTSSGTASGNS